MLNGALLGVSEVNSSKAARVTLEPEIVDPAGMLTRYAEITSALLVGGIRQIVGCYTSVSRKEVIPCLEKHDGLLWYPSHYEGFETANNVIYTGAAPNQHIVPLVDYLTAQYGNRALCVGSNYIWAWENNRILREAMTSRGGTVLAERYLPVGEKNLTQLVETIINARPSFVFSSLLLGTLLTVLAADQDFGIMNPVIALAIACTKAVIVILFFMHVKYQSNLIKMTVVSGFFTFIVLITMTLSDYISRAWGLW